MAYLCSWSDESASVLELHLQKESESEIAEKMLEAVGGGEELDVT